MYDRLLLQYRHQVVSLDIKLRRTTTAQQVADGLSELIMSGRFEPGTRLRESAIAAELGVSRNTVREAVRVLQLGGLVRHEVNRGAVVITPTSENVRSTAHAPCSRWLRPAGQPLQRTT